MGRKSSTKPRYDAAAAVAEARSYVGCKWRHRGRSRFGIDCVGLIVAATAAGGVQMRDRRDYGRVECRHKMLKADEHTIRDRIACLSEDRLGEIGGQRKLPEEE